MARALTHYAATYTVLYAAIAFSLVVNLLAYGLGAAILYAVGILTGVLVALMHTPRSPRAEREGGR